MTVIERFLKYVTFDTQSDESTGVTPSTPKQMVFAQYLKTELEELGLKDISLDENGYLFATLPSNVNHEVPVVGFIAHMDTSPDMSGENVKPRIVEKYDGKDIPLCAEENIILSPANFPELLDHVGEDFLLLALIPEVLLVDIGLGQLVECLGKQRTSGDVLQRHFLLAVRTE